MSKDPAFLFYFRDFLVSTEFLSSEEVGDYIRILCHMADKGHLTLKHMQSICKAYGTAHALHNKFKIDEKGLFYNERLEVEVEKRRFYTESRRINAKHMHKHMPKHMGNANINANAIVITKEESLKKSRSFSRNPPKSSLFSDFFNLHLHYTNQKYVSTNENKDMSQLNKIVEELGEEEVRIRLDRFFKSKSKFILENGYSIGIFYSQINFLTEKQNKGKWNDLN